MLLDEKINSAVEIFDIGTKENLWFMLKDNNTKEGIVFIVVYNRTEDTLNQKFLIILRTMLLTNLKPRKQGFVQWDISMSELEIWKN